MRRSSISYDVELQGNNPTSESKEMYSQEDRTFLNAVMARDSVRNLPELRDIASRKYPLPLRQLCVKINYCVVPPTFDIFPLHSHTIYAGSDIITTKLRQVFDDSAGTIRRRKQTIILGEISFGSYSRNMYHVMDSLWDNSEYGRLDTMIRVAQSSANDLGTEGGIHDLPGNWQCVGHRTEMDNPKLRKWIKILVKEERKRWNDVQGTWLTA